jgi:hypothetical protein
VLHVEKIKKASRCEMSLWLIELLMHYSRFVSANVASRSWLNKKKIIKKRYNSNADTILKMKLDNFLLKNKTVLCAMEITNGIRNNSSLSVNLVNYLWYFPVFMLMNYNFRCSSIQREKHCLTFFSCKGKRN